MNQGGKVFSEPTFAPLHSSLGNRARLCLKKRKTEEKRKKERKGRKEKEREKKERNRVARHSGSRL